MVFVFFLGGGGGGGLLLETHHRIWLLLHANITRHHAGRFVLLSLFLYAHHRFVPSHWEHVGMNEHLMAPMQVDPPHIDFRYGPG